MSRFMLRGLAGVSRKRLEFLGIACRVLRHEKDPNRGLYIV